IFLLGNTSWRIRRVEAGRVRVEDANGAPPTIPFWLGEAPARTVELSREVGELRRGGAARIDRGERPGAGAARAAGRGRVGRGARGRGGRGGARDGSAGRRADRRLPGGWAAGARRAADGGDDRRRAVLRRGGRHAARAARAARGAHQPRLGAGAEEAVLQELQL